MMLKLIDDLLEDIGVMYRIGDIDGRAYLRLTGNLMALKKQFESSDFCKAVALYNAIKAVRDV